MKLLFLLQLISGVYSFTLFRSARTTKTVGTERFATLLESSTSGNNDLDTNIGLGRYEAMVRKFQTNLDNLYNKSLKIKCPFFRRRATDSIDGVAMVIQFVLARHKSLPTLTLPGSQSMGTYGQNKIENLSLIQLTKFIEADWRGKQAMPSSNGANGKGYYITGKLTKEIYRDDCFFDGPDPDMPVLGLRKYVTSTSQLFDQKISRADMIDNIVIDEVARTMTVHWRLEGILNLPWHPRLKPWTGTTTYHVDQSGLIEKHIETWDISVLDAFASTLFPFLSIGAPPAAPLSVMATVQHQKSD